MLLESVMNVPDDNQKGELLAVIRIALRVYASGGTVRIAGDGAGDEDTNESV